MNQKLIDYIKQAQAQGHSNEQITGNLKTKGWRDEEIAETFQTIQVVLEPVPTALLASKSLLPVIGIAVVAIFLVGGSIFAALYTNTWSPTWSPFNLSSQEVIARMISENKKIDFFDVESTGEVSQEEYGTISKFVVHSIIDESDPNVLKIRISGSVKGLLFGEETQKIEGIIIDQDAYIRLESSGWEKIDINNDYFALFDINNLKYSEALDVWLGDPTLYTIEKEFLDEKLDGLKVYHYQLSFDPSIIFRIDPELKNLVSDDISLFLDLIGDISVEIWIDKKSNRLVQFTNIIDQFGIRNYLESKYLYPEKIDNIIEAPL